MGTIIVDNITETVIYGSEFHKYRDKLYEGIKDGLLTVRLDYNRVSWPILRPEDCIIYRVRASTNHAVAI